VKLSINRGFG